MIGFHIIELTLQDVTIVNHPKSQNVTESHEVMLECGFSTGVHCVWIRNKGEVTIEGRYKFNKGHDGKNAKDCSLKITQSCKDIDEGIWTCSNHVTDDVTTGIKSNPAQLLVISDKDQKSALNKFPSSVPTDGPIDKVDTLIIAVAAIAGVVIIIIVIIVVIVWCHCRKKKNQANRPASSLSTSALQQVRYPEPVIQPMLYLQQGQNAYTPEQVVCSNTNFVGIMPMQNQSNHYLVPLIRPTAPLIDKKLSNSSSKQEKRERPKYENVGDNHLYDEIEDN